MNLGGSMGGPEPARGANPKLIAGNKIIRAAAAELAELDLYKKAGSPETGAAVFMAKLVDLERDTIRACYAMSTVESNPEADETFGAVLLQRLEIACAAQPIGKLERLATAALQALDDWDAASHRLPTEVNLWQEAMHDLHAIAMEFARRANDRAFEAQMEAMRRAAEMTPGMSMRFTEDVGGTIIRDETVYGPEPGEEASAGVSRLSSDAVRVLGMDRDDAGLRAQAAVDDQLSLLAEKFRVQPGDKEGLRLKVAEACAKQGLHDSQCRPVDDIEDLTNLRPGHLASLRSSLSASQNSALLEGATYSRYKRGDKAATIKLLTLVARIGIAVHATPYYLPADLVPTAENSLPLADLRLPEGHAAMVFHDHPVEAGGGVTAVAWVFTTDRSGRLHDIGVVTADLGTGQLGSDLFNLNHGQIAPTGRAVASALTVRSWRQPKPLRLSGEVGSRTWRRDFARSQARIRDEGALLGVRLPTDYATAVDD